MPPVTPDIPENDSVMHDQSDELVSYQHKIKIKKEDLNTILNTFLVCPDTNVPTPPLSQAPIEGIKVSKDASQCYGSQTDPLPFIAPPTRDYDLTILVKELGWYKYIQSTDRPLSWLSQVVEGYLKQIQTEESNMTRYTLCSLKNYPIVTGDSFKIYQEQQSFNRARLQLTKFIAICLHQVVTFLPDVLPDLGYVCLFAAATMSQVFNIP
ncbi:hypothetical protein EDB84DRAFT_1435865 [Lactarius hengduanensis]|nr:hypothetical protein EDB84DRAFT_1435865 [Lactarius hengduanensis]